MGANISLNLAQLVVDDLLDESLLMLQFDSQNLKKCQLFPVLTFIEDSNLEDISKIEQLQQLHKSHPDQYSFEFPQLFSANSILSITILPRVKKRSRLPELFLIVRRTKKYFHGLHGKSKILIIYFQA
ncbi:hypothetical protein WA026_015267 [Henosepilachna vigintioctopunctata]|uniref:Uncharacterized protein n=1 Tax=Henosepilachna vigintioctopunctata TaxID=420089 RepID=A0AAW1TUF2_9CUCU